MREILYRGQMKSDNGENKKGKWVFGHYCELIDGKKIIPYIYHKGEIIKETLGQYTGLTDKNGNKIFEGDIVEFESHGYIPSSERGTVIFKDGCYGIEYEDDFIKKYGWDKKFHRIGMVSEWQDMGASGTITYTYEVIGNIHDNPELLKGGAE